MVLIYVFGGGLEACAYLCKGRLSSVETFDTDTGVWTIGTSLRSQRAGCVAACVALPRGQQVIVFGDTPAVEVMPMDMKALSSKVHNHSARKPSQLSLHRPLTRPQTFGQ